MPATINDVATRAGVSTKTVSRVVNDEPGVSPTTRERVLEAVRETGYAPDPAARSLRTGRSQVIGLAVPELGQPFFAEIADRIAQAARSHDLGLVLGVTGEQGQGEADFLERNPGLDGTILYWQGLSAAHLSAEAARRPLVVIGEYDHDAVDRVTMDNERGITLALEHLLALGRERLAVIGLPEPGVRAHAAARRRTAALRDALTAHDLTLDERLLVPSAEWRRPDGARCARRLLDQAVPFDAILAFNDGLALGALAELRAAGVTVPDDVAVTGFDNLDASRYSFPSLTTVSPRLASYAAHAVDLLVARIEDPSRAPRTEVAGVTLMARDSTIGGGALWPSR
ncbi:MULTISPECIES: LacI family DNA-binding transcriptional regulator [Actinomyces]|uniref:LacI family DNA-binding transcriptional regulator n=1 Tax=Actinomyces respiraculi TaxID=2744574 RepID=A0A7T0LKL8_9ACTO|nr:MULTISPECIES: LacI family DNA-binding transcriptional regulator [Actinomyces]QPL05068.1 LacI family DNA-binding transcriptional regulator [Actinomyces respiraculi]